MIRAIRVTPRNVIRLVDRQRKVCRYGGFGTLAFAAIVIPYGHFWKNDDAFSTGVINTPVAIMFLILAWVFDKVRPILVMAEEAERVAKLQWDLHEMRLAALALQEQRAEETLEALRVEHQKERQLLLEIREEREAELKTLGFVQGLKQGPEVREYLNNPRLRLRALPQQSDPEERQGKAS